MQNKLIFLSKISITFFFLIISFQYLNSGYSSINKIIINNNLNFEKLAKTNDHINEDNKLFLDEEKKSNLNELDKIENLKFEDKEFNTTFKQELIIVKKGDNFSKIINSFLNTNKEKQEIISLIQGKYNVRSLKINQKIYISKDENDKILELVIPINFNTDLIIKKNIEGNFIIKEKILPINSHFQSQKFIINNSLFEDGISAGLPLPILSKVIQLYSFDIDFQRDIRKGNQLEIYYESFYNEIRRTVSYGKIYYIKLFLKKNELGYFLFKTDDKLEDYYNKDGKNVKKALLKTPIDGARLSSVFGMRKHPILGYNKMHKGTDFAASKGTPVFAGGNGRIEYIGRNGSYGNYIRINHNNSYKTAYAHLYKFAKISKGSIVIQGQTIGYVGSTGNSTGPHLHYEIIYKNKQINPKLLNLPSGRTLENNELKRFKKEIADIYSDFLFTLYE